MKKLLLGLIASLALISTSTLLYAACTQNVEMGGNQIKDLGNGTTSGDAVNYGQTLQRSVADVLEDNISILESYSAAYNVIVEKVGNMCILQGLVLNTSGSDITSPTNFGTVPVGYRPNRIARTELEGSAQNAVFVGTDGILSFQFNASVVFPAGSYVNLNLPYVCQ
jgi:hypothetical protein